MIRKITGVFLGLIFASALYPQSRLAPPNDPAAAARRGESEIIINAAGSEKDIAVWVNSILVAHVFPKTTEKIIVRDGRNIIHAAETTLSRGQWSTGDRKELVVDCASNQVTIGFLMRYGRLINLNVQQTIAIQPQGGGGTVPAAASGPVRPSRPAASANDNTIEGAVNRAAEALIIDLPDGSTLAIISIASRDADMAEFVIEELAYLMVDTKKFKVVDRKSLDAIQAEQNFQYSGDVDDNSAVSIGKLLGASIVITGSISGSGSTRRLRAKALDVKTAEIVAMASERF
ncbi:MAG: CsgG/HfaB family protein [Spirochaetaceae bacterium]|jgi:TolB-like protein|nr:CsgG/HfaB family protein [Spirochaetaceae bacterium]